MPRKPRIYKISTSKAQSKTTSGSELNAVGKLHISRKPNHGHGLP